MLGNIRRRGESWQASVEGPRKNGRRRRIYKSFDTEAKARRFIASQTVDVHSGHFVEPNDLTVEDVVNEFLNTRDVAPNTHATLVSFARRLVDELGAMAVQRVTHPILLNHMAAVRTGPRRDGRPGQLMAWSVDHHVRLVKAVFGWAKKVGYTSHDPSVGLARPRRVRGRMTILRPHETHLLQRALVGTSMEAPVSIAIATGLRRGEVLALRWARDVDLDEGYITVTEGVTERKRGGLTYGPPKTLASQRTIRLPAWAREWLKDFASGAAVAHGGTLPEFVCTSASAGRWRPRGFSKEFRKFIRRTGQRPMRFHDLRHSHAAQLIWAGVHMKAISVRLGHSSVAFTMDVYGHLLPGVDAEAMAQFDRRLMADEHKYRAALS